MCTNFNAVMALTPILGGVHWTCVSIYVTMETHVSSNGITWVMPSYDTPTQLITWVMPSYSLRFIFFLVGPKRWSYLVLWLPGIFWILLMLIYQIKVLNCSNNNIKKNWSYQPEQNIVELIVLSELNWHLKCAYIG